MPDHRIVSLTEPKNIPLGASVSFYKFGVKLAGRVVGISHDHPMRYDLRLDNDALVTDVPESEIDSVTDALASTSKAAASGRALVTLLTASRPEDARPTLVQILRSRRRQAYSSAARAGIGATDGDATVRPLAARI